MALSKIPNLFEVTSGSSPAAYCRFHWIKIPLGRRSNVDNYEKSGKNNWRESLKLNVSVENYGSLIS